MAEDFLTYQLRTGMLAPSVEGRAKSPGIEQLWEEALRRLEEESKGKGTTPVDISTYAEAPRTVAAEAGVTPPWTKDVEQEAAPAEKGYKIPGWEDFMPWEISRGQVAGAYALATGKVERVDQEQLLREAGMPEAIITLDAAKRAAWLQDNPEVREKFEAAYQPLGEEAAAKATKEYKEWKAPTIQTGVYTPEFLGNQEITFGVKGALELAAELPFWFTAGAMAAGGAAKALRYPAPKLWELAGRLPKGQMIPTRALVAPFYGAQKALEATISAPIKLGNKVWSEIAGTASTRRVATTVEKLVRKQVLQQPLSKQEQRFLLAAEKKGLIPDELVERISAEVGEKGKHFQSIATSLQAEHADLAAATAKRYALSQKLFAAWDKGNRAPILTKQFQAADKEAQRLFGNYYAEKMGGLTEENVAPLLFGGKIKGKVPKAAPATPEVTGVADYWNKNLEHNALRVRNETDAGAFLSWHIEAAGDITREYSKGRFKDWNYIYEKVRRLQREVGSRDWTDPLSASELKSLTKIKIDVSKLPVGDEVTAQIKKILTAVTNRTVKSVKAETDKLDTMFQVMRAKPVLPEAATITAEKGIINKINTAVAAARKIDRELVSVRAGEKRAVAAKIHKAAEAAPEATKFFEAAGKARKGGKLTVGEYEAIATKISAEEIAACRNYIMVTKRLPGMKIHTRINADTAFVKLLQGEHLQRNEMLLLQQVFGKGMGKALSGRVGLKEATMDALVELWGLPKSLMASFDLSAPLRQGALLMWGNPVEGFKNFKPMVKYFFNPKYYDESMSLLTLKKHYGLLRDANKNLFTSMPGETGMGFLEAEEFFQSRLAEKLPLGIGKIVSASERAFVGYLNNLRYDVGEKYINMWIRQGMKPYGKDFWQVQELSKLLATFTGRGSLGSAEQMIGTLNTLFFAPKLVASRFQAPFLLASRSNAVKKIAARNISAFIAANAGLLGLADITGVAKVGWNPTSSDFMKANIGGVRIDIAAGYAPMIRYAAQVWGGKRKATTGRLQEINRAETILRFARSKAAPMTGLIWSWLSGSDFTGQKIEDYEDSLQLVAQSLFPLFGQDLWEAYQQAGGVGLAAATPGLIGGSIVAYDDTLNIVGEVHYEFSRYSELEVKMRDLYKEMELSNKPQAWKAKKVQELKDKNPEARWAWDEQREMVYSQTARELRNYDHELYVMRNKRDDIVDDQNLDDHTRELMLEELDAEMERLSIAVLSGLDRILDTIPQ